MGDGGPENSVHSGGSYLVRLLDDPGPRPMDLPSDRHSFAIDAACGSHRVDKRRPRPIGAQGHISSRQPVALPVAIAGLGSVYVHVEQKHLTKQKTKLKSRKKTKVKIAFKRKNRKEKKGKTRK